MTAGQLCTGVVTVTAVTLPDIQCLLSPGAAVRSWAIATRQPVRVADLVAIVSFSADDPHRLRELAKRTADRLCRATTTC